MNVTCKDRDRIFEDGSPAEWAALEVHAANCKECAEEVHAWKELSVAAAELRDYTESPALWQRIERALVKEGIQSKKRVERWGWLKVWSFPAFSWQMAAIAAFVVALTVSAGWYYVRTERPMPAAGIFLKDDALAEVERAESAYVKAIDRLAQQAKPEIDNPATPLLANYHEKLLVLDSAIGELRTQTEENPGNAHLRRELLAMYQEKQDTLEAILEEKK